MTSKQNAAEYVKDQMQRGLMTAAQANVKMIQIEGVRVVRGKLFSDVRKALNEAVKNGELGHLKKDGLKPEVYFNINSKARALELRDQEFFNSIESLKKIYA